MKTTGVQTPVTQAEAFLRNRLWLNVEEFGNLTGLSSGAVHQRIRRGVIPTVKFGSSRMIPVAFARTLTSTEMTA